jgi:hypothetical protein
MTTTEHPPTTDPLALLDRLSAEEIRNRIDRLDAEQRALRVLLRSVLARERALAKRQEARHAP